MDNRIIIDINKVKEIRGQLVQDQEKVDEIFENIKNIMKNVNDDNWKGKTSQNVAEKFSLLSNNFPDISTQLKNYNEYLANVINNYEQADKDVNTTIENNSDNLDVN